MDKQWEEYVTNFWSGIYKTTHAIVSIVYSNAVGRNMSVISQKLFCYFYTLKKKNQTKKAFLNFLVHIQMQNKTPSLLYMFICTNQVHMKFTFYIRHTSEFSKQPLPPS
jgi:hypothetical protein